MRKIVWIGLAIAMLCTTNAYAANLPDWTFPRKINEIRVDDTGTVFYIQLDNVHHIDDCSITDWVIVRSGDRNIKMSLLLTAMATGLTVRFYATTCYANYPQGENIRIYPE